MTPQSLNAASPQPGILGNVLTVCVGKSLIRLVIICHMLNRIAIKKKNFLQAIVTFLAGASKAVLELVEVQW